MSGDGGPRHVRFEPGDTLALITDGFFEWLDGEGVMFGLDRVEASIRHRRQGTPAEIIAGLHDDVLRFCGGTEQADDLTAVVVKRHDSGGGG